MDFDHSTEDHLGGGSQKVIAKNDKFTTFHMVAFIIIAVAGREYSGWQPALVQGFGQFMIAEIILAAAFINSYFCLAEIWSAIPFSGGGYGLARAVMGFYPGFLVGCADALVYITHSAVGALFLGDKICLIAGLHADLSLVFVFTVYALAVFLAIQPSVVTMRRSFVILAIIAIGVLCIYLFGSLGWTDFHLNASLQKSSTFSAPENWLSGGIKGFMVWLPFASLPYAGVKSFTLMSAVTNTPKVTLPRAVCIALPFIFAVNMFVVFVNASQPGGILHTASLPLPMAVGFEKMFNLTVDTGFRVAAFLAFPAAFGKVYAYMVPSGTLLQSLGRTNLLPSFMMLNHNKDHSQGTIVTATLGFLMCLLIHYQPQVDLYNLCILATAFSNITSSYCYIKLKYSCPTLERGFVNPLGVSGAIFSALLFLLMFISAAFLQSSYDPLIGISVLLVVLTVYYYGLAAKTQTLCKEEDKVFLLLHVKNFNRNKKRGNKFKGNRAAIPTFRSHNSESSLHGTNKKVSPETSVSVTSASDVGLWAQFRKFNNLFSNNVVAPSAGNSTSSSAAASSKGNSISLRDFKASTVAPAPTVVSPVSEPDIEEAVATAVVVTEEDTAEGEAKEEVRGAEMV